jgi:peptidoglycan/LPS O-acetylase OafA/YrhL
MKIIDNVKAPLKPRNINLDALRGIAVLLVLGRHFECFLLWTKIGWAGVDLFFVLSGFLISGLLFREWKEHGKINIKLFYIRRGLKIYPAFYALLAVTLAADAAGFHLSTFPVTPASIIAEVAFIQNYFPGFWGHTWSLAVEEHFYLALPLILLFWHAKPGTCTNPFCGLPKLFAVVACTDVIIRLLLNWKLSGFEYYMYLTPTVLRIDALLFGVALSYYRHFEPEKFSQISKSTLGLLITAATITLLVVMPIESPFMHTIGFTMVFLASGFILARTIDARPGRYVAALRKTLATIGVYSYSIYLWHFGISRIITSRSVTAFVLYLVCSVGWGILMANLIEHPALALRDRLFSESFAGRNPTPVNVTGIATLAGG